MPFIGVFAKENDNNFIKNEICKNSKTKKFEVFNINKKSLDNLKNVKFDVLIIKEDISKLLETSNYIRNIIEKANYILVNIDIKENKILVEKNKSMITYGFNTNAKITISRIKEDNIMLCIQNKIQDINEKIIEEQEVGIKIMKHNINKLYNIMVVFTVLKIYGEFIPHTLS